MESFFGKVSGYRSVTLQKRIPSQLFLDEFNKILWNSFFIEHLQTTVSVLLFFYRLIQIFSKEMFFEKIAEFFKLSVHSVVVSQQTSVLIQLWTTAFIRIYYSIRGRRKRILHQVNALFRGRLKTIMMNLLAIPQSVLIHHSSMDYILI